MNKPVGITLEDLQQRRKQLKYEISKNNKNEIINYEHVDKFLLGALAEIEYLIEKLEKQRFIPTKFRSIVERW